MGEQIIEPERDEYFYPDGKSAGWLTWDESLEAGFCPACGSFVAGIDGEIPYLSKYEMCYDCYQDEAIQHERDDEQWDYL